MEGSGRNVFVLSRKLQPNYKTIVCDLSKVQIPRSAFKYLDCVFHLAGYAHDLKDASKLEHVYREINVNATIKLAELASEAAALASEAQMLWPRQQHV